MKTSDTIVKITGALIQAQSEITFAPKDANNTFHHSKYADLPSVIDSVKPALNKNGIAFIQSASPSDPGTLALTTRLLHVSGEWIEDTATVPLPKADPQGYGSAMTYARRYSLAAFTGLYQDDDDGNAASLPPKQEPTMPRAIPSQAPRPEFKAAMQTQSPVAPPQQNWPSESNPETPHANVQKVLNVMGGQVMGDPNKPVSQKQIARAMAMINSRKIPEEQWRRFIDVAMGKKHLSDLTNGEISSVYYWIENYRS